MDISLGFVEPWDHYLDRLLAGLDPNSSHFVKGVDNDISTKQCYFLLPLFWPGKVQ